MAVVGGWAVFSDRATCKKGGADLQRLLPLFDALIVPEGAGSMDIRDPAVLYLLARQQFGGLTAITMPALGFFNMAQALLSSHLTQPLIAQFGAHTFQIGVEDVVRNQTLRATFMALMPANADAALSRIVYDRLLSKFFNQAGMEFRKQIESIWGSGGGKSGTSVPQEMKVLQKRVAKDVKKKAKRVPAEAFKKPPRLLHMTLTLIVEEEGAEALGRGTDMAQLKALLLAYAADGQKPKTSGSKAELVERLAAVVKGAEGFARPPVFAV